MKHPIRSFLEKKYSSAITDLLLSPQNEVLLDKKDYGEGWNLLVKEHLEKLEKENLFPKEFFVIDWGMDFSSWLDKFDNEHKKEFMFIGAEPNVRCSNYQLVYDFGTKINESTTTTAVDFARGGDIWHYLTRLFADIDSEKSIVSFLTKCYITDICHIVPKNCGTVAKISEKLKIKQSEWKSFRNKVADSFLQEEIRTVSPKFIILHGAVSRNYFSKHLRVEFKEVKTLSPKHFVRTGEWENYKIISIPHLKGQMKNEIWRNERRFAMIKEAVAELV